MAKKDGYEAFLAECVATIPEGKRAQFEEMAKDPEVAAALKERVLARSEFSRQMDSLKEERRAFESTVAEANRNIEGWKNWYSDAVTQFSEADTKLAAYRETYGDLESGTKPRFLTEEAATERLQKELANRDRMAIKFADVLTDIKLEHRERFKERLNTDELLAFADKNGLRLVDAYKEFVADRAKELDEAALGERIKKEREAAVAEYATQHRLPVAPRSNEPHPLDAAIATPKEQRDRVAAAVAGWNARPVS